MHLSVTASDTFRPPPSKTFTELVFLPNGVFCRIKSIKAVAPRRGNHCSILSSLFIQTRTLKASEGTRLGRVHGSVPWLCATWRCPGSDNTVHTGCTSWWLPPWTNLGSRHTNTDTVLMGAGSGAPMPASCLAAMHTLGAPVFSAGACQVHVKCSAKWKAVSRPKCHPGTYRH